MAGNATTTFTVGNSVRYKVLYGSVDLTTDATVANRRVVLKALASDSTVLFNLQAGAVTTASTSNSLHEYGPGLPRETSAVSSSLLTPIPSELIIPTGGSLTISVTSGVAGDAYEADFLVEQLPA